MFPSKIGGLAESGERMELVYSYLTNPIVSQAIGLVIGLTTSFVSWWILFHGLAPRVVCENQIIKNDRGTDTAPRYTIKVSNVGSRMAIDIECALLLRFYKAPGSNGWRGFYLSTSNNGNVARHLYRAFPKRRGGLAEIIGIRPETSEALGKFLTEAFPELPDQKQMKDLEWLFGVGEKAELTVYITAYDSFSGAKKLSVQKFDRKSIK